MRCPSIVLAALVALLCASVLAPPAHADQSDGVIEIKASTEPAALAPGGSGTLVIEATLFEKLHIYATERGGQQALTWKPIAVEGVTYDIAKAKLSSHHEYVDPNFGDTFDVFETSFTIRVPVTVSTSVAAGTEVGVAVSYAGCTDEICYPPVKDQAAKVALGGAGPAVVPANGGGDAPANPNVAANPVKRKFQATFEKSGGAAKVELSDDKSKVIVTFTPEFGHKLYRPPLPGESPEGKPVSVKPVESQGVTWGEFEIEPGTYEESPFTVEVPITFDETAREAVLDIEWQACTTGKFGTCLSPVPVKLSVVVGEGKGGESPDEPVPPTPPAPPTTGDVIFEVVRGDDIAASKDNYVQEFYKKYGLLVLLVVFGLGVGLAFTPCVLPIIPITVAVVTGGRTDLPRKRLLGLLSTYVAGMACTFGVVGAISALAGGSMSAAFQIPAVIWGIAGLFAALSFGMLGVVELQPPQWMTRMQGSAQQKGGSFVGAALLGALMALVASPCTGPFIVGMAVLTTQTGSPAFGFALFASMGLGMGAVMFAFGALNFALRPGPWMVWVRYGFGMLLFGGALYYVADGQLLVPPALYIVGLVVAALAWFLVSRHLVKAEGETPRIARSRGMKVGIMYLAATALVALLTRVPPLPDNVDPKLVAFETVQDVDHLKRAVAESVQERRPTVIDVWGTWCHNCKVYSQFIIEDAQLRHEFSKVRRLKIDISEDNRDDLRDALGIPRTIQPFFVFIDGKGRIRRAADVDRWYGEKEDSKEALIERLQLVLGKEFGSGKGRPLAIEGGH